MLSKRERLANILRLGRRVKAGTATWLDCPDCGHEECHGCEGNGPLDGHGNQLLSEDEVNALTDLAEQRAEDGRG